MAAPPARPVKAGGKPRLVGQMDDLAGLANLDEDILNEELMERYRKDVIYVSFFLLTFCPF